MNTKLTPLAIANISSGIIFIVMSFLRFSRYQIPIILLAFSLLFLVGGFIDEQLKGKRILSENPEGQIEIETTNQRFEVALFIFNILAIIILWYPTLFVWSHTFEGYVLFGLRLGFFVLILNRDFVKLGRELSRIIGSS